MKVIVIGGGIGGLTTALSLLDKGIQVEVYEQAAELKEIGAGLQIGANGSRVLTRLGLGPDLERLGVAIHAIEMRLSVDFSFGLAIGSVVPDNGKNHASSSVRVSMGRRPV